MGSDKALLPFDGVPMVLRVAAALRAAGCAPVVAIGGDEPSLRALGLPVLLDEHPGEGPLGGVLTALHGLAGHPAVVVTACDLPHLTAATVLAVLGALDSAGDGGRDGGLQPDVAMPFTDRLQPLCAAWRPSGEARLSAEFARGERSIRGAIASLVVAEVAGAPQDLANVNTPADLRQ